MKKSADARRDTVINPLSWHRSSGHKSKSTLKIIAQDLRRRHHSFSELSRICAASRGKIPNSEGDAKGRGRGGKRTSRTLHFARSQLPRITVTIPAKLSIVLPVNIAIKTTSAHLTILLIQPILLLSSNKDCR